MKNRPDYRAAYERMLPGTLSAEGFIGTDTRSLADIIESDEELCARLGLDFEKLADLISSLMQQAAAGLGEPITLAPGLIGQLFESRGTIACPFNDGIFKKTNLLLTRETPHTTIMISGLSQHLLERHHFLQGRDARFRIEPLILKTVLGDLYH